MQPRLRGDAERVEHRELGARVGEGGGEDAAVRVAHHELGAVRVDHLEGEASLVNQAVVGAAEENEVGEVGGAAVEPVVDVVGVQPRSVRAAGEAAAVVAQGEGAAEPTGDDAGAAADVERGPLGS